MMFGRNIDLTSFLISALLTIIFAVLVNLVMYYKLKKIHMVESLKSVD
jgi:putative ABC transport system permease protein